MGGGWEKSRRRESEELWVLFEMAMVKKKRTTHHKIFNSI